MILTCSAHPSPAPKRASATAIVQRYRVSCVVGGRVPSPTGRQALARDLVSLRRQLIIDGGRTIAPFLALCFRDTLRQICDRATERASLDQAIADTLSPANDRRLITAYTPLIQSIAAKAYGRARLFLGEPPRATASIAILRVAQQQAQRIPRLHETLRVHLSRAITASSQDGAPLAESISRIRDSIPALTATHVPALARREVSHAIDRGIKEAFQTSPGAADATVVGCPVDASAPTFDGIPIFCVRDLAAPGP